MDLFKIFVMALLWLLKLLLNLLTDTRFDYPLFKQLRQKLNGSHLNQPPNRR